MAKNYVQEGDVIPYSNAGAAIVSGAVVKIGANGDALLGIALTDIATNEIGSVALEGVFTVPKVSAAVITQGEYILWDASAAAFDDNLAVAAAGDVADAAIAFESAGNGVTTIKAKLIGKPGVLS